MIRIVPPFKTDAAVFESTRAVVGDSHTVGIASQVFEQALRSGEGRLDVNHPTRFWKVSGAYLKVERRFSLLMGIGSPNLRKEEPP
jgi:hypothetical protein